MELGRGLERAKDSKREKIEMTFQHFFFVTWHVFSNGGFKRTQCMVSISTFYSNSNANLGLERIASVRTRVMWIRRRWRLFTGSLRAQCADWQCADVLINANLSTFGVSMAQTCWSKPSDIESTIPSAELQWRNLKIDVTQWAGWHCSVPRILRGLPK